MKTTLSDDQDGENCKKVTNHAERINKIHNQRVQNYLKTEM